MDAFSTPKNALSFEGNKLSKCGLRHGEAISLFYSAIADDK